jgi:hypothetical protein
MTQVTRNAYSIRSKWLLRCLKQSSSDCDVGLTSIESYIIRVFYAYDVNENRHTGDLVKCTQDFLVCFPYFEKIKVGL